MRTRWVSSKRERSFGPLSFTGDVTFCAQDSVDFQLLRQLLKIPIIFSSFFPSQEHQIYTQLSLPLSSSIMYTLATYAILDHKTWNETPLDGPSTTSKVPRMTSVTSELEFHKAQGHDPGMQGQAVTHLIWSHPTSEMVGKPSVFTGHTSFVGQIGRRLGTLTLSCTGTYTPRTGNLKADLEVLWGTGDLEGAKGDGGWERLAGPPDAGTSWLDLAPHAKLITGAEVVLDLEFPN